MRVETVTEPDVDAATDEAICRLQRRAFPATEQFRHGRHWIHHARPGDVHVLLWDDGRPMAQAVVFWAEAAQGRLACLGNVCSDPDVRGRGWASECVRKAVDVARTRAVDWALLFSDELNRGFYEKRGFEHIEHAVWYTRTDGTTYAHGADGVCMVLIVGDRPWPTDKLVLDIEMF